MKKKLGISLCILSVLILTVTGCGKKAELDDNKTAVSLKGIKITATDYYNEIKTSNISKLVDMIDHQLFDEKYKSDDEENQAVKEQINQLKESYSDETTFLSVIQQYFGVNSEDELEDMLRLEYKRNEAVEEFVADNLTDKEIEEYYDKNIIGDIKASHILITPDVDSDATDEEKEKAEEKAKKKAERIIKKLDEGEDFAELAKEYSDDEATKDNGGSLGAINTGSLSSSYDELLKAARELKDGEYSTELITTELGYHVIYRESSSEKPSYEDSKDDIQETLANEKIEEDATIRVTAMDELRKKYGMDILDSDLKEKYSNYIANQIANARSNS